MWNLKKKKSYKVTYLQNKNWATDIESKFTVIRRGEEGINWEIGTEHIHTTIHKRWASQVARMVKNLPANTRDIRDRGSIPGSGRSPGGGNGNPCQYSCLENPMNGSDIACTQSIYKRWIISCMAQETLFRALQRPVQEWSLEKSGYMCECVRNEV